MRYKDSNDVVYAVARRANELGSKSVDTLRLLAGYECETQAEAKAMNKHLGRGELIELILCEEFVEEFPQTFTLE